MKQHTFSRRIFCPTAFLLLLSLFPATLLAARSYISIVGSSTIFPFATVVAERFGKSSGFRTPVIISTGTGGGFKIFCAGIGENYPDIVNASRTITASERQKCTQNSVSEIVEAKIGYDGIVFANSRATRLQDISRKDLFMALAQVVPDPEEPSRLIRNPYKSWHDLNPTLPDTPIMIYGPPPTSGTRDAFAEYAMEYGAMQFKSLAELRRDDPAAFARVSQKFREDGAFINAGENDNIIVQKIISNPHAFGIFGFSFLNQNSDILQGTVIEGELPTINNIANGLYPLSRPLYIYIKKAHTTLIPGLRRYLAEFTGESAWGENGYLSEKGMIPMPRLERIKNAEIIRELKPLPAE